MRSDEDLNRRFYEESPSSYFTYRLSSLVWYSERWEDISTLFDSPTFLGPVQVGGFDPDSTENPDAQHERARFVATESLVLFHHVGEVLVRLFLAHRGLPAVPWFEVAALVDFRTFRKEIESLVRGNPRLEEDVEVVFLAGLSEDTSTATARRFYATLLRRVARRLLDEAKAYNSAKHGLAVRAGSASLTVAPEDAEGKPIVGRAIRLGDGPAVEYLEWDRRPDGRAWKHTTRWVDVPQTIAMTYFALEAIESLWTVGRGRYLDEVGGKIWLPRSKLDDLLPNPTGGSSRSWSTYLGVEPH